MDRQGDPDSFLQQPARFGTCQSRSKGRSSDGRGTTSCRTSLERKLAPSPAPERWEDGPPVAPPERAGEARRASRRSQSRRRPAACRRRAGRARALHTFLHHELQAAELMAWAILAFPDTPRDFRAGLVRIALDEVRHMRLYARADRAARASRGRASPCATGSGSGSCLVLGSPVLRRDDGARVREREPGAHGFLRRALPRGGRRGGRARPGDRGSGGDRARALRCALVRPVHGRARLRERGALALPVPLSPLLMRGRPLQRDARLRAGFSEDFLDGSTHGNPYRLGPEPRRRSRARRRRDATSRHAASGAR